MMLPLRQGSKRPAVRDLQHAYNQRAKQRGWPPIAEDGECGPLTLKAAHRAAYALGALTSTLKTARATRTISVGMQRLIRRPERRSSAQIQRGKDRAVKAAQASSGPDAALRWARQWIGRTESPPGSNRGDWGLTQWQRDLGAWLVGAAWCGVYVGTALKRAGVKGITTRVAAVSLILDDAANKRNGFSRLVFRRRTGTGFVTAGRPGDLVGLFGESTHVGMIVRRVAGGYLTREGNTSPPGNSGSQSNGGGCWERIRPDSAVVYIARPNYPEG